MLIEGRNIKAAILDLDGVITDTADLHARAWKKMFDGFLPHREQSPEPFSTERDYRLYVDGKPRDEGLKSFLQARQIEVPDGTPDDPPGTFTVHGLGKLKNQFFRDLLNTEGPRVIGNAVEQLRQWKNRGLKIAIVSSSRNATEVLERAEILTLPDTIIDGNDQDRLHLDGKPSPASFLEAAKRLGVDPKLSIVAEDSLAGVKAGRNGGFALVVGVDSKGLGQELIKNGADIVVPDLSRIEDLEAQEWKIAYRRWEPRLQRTREVMCALGNGYQITRGAFAESQSDGIHYPGCYLAGGYDRTESEVAGRIVSHEDLVNWPNWLCLDFRIGDGAWFNVNDVRLLEFKQELDVKYGLLTRTLEFEDSANRLTRLHEKRFVHMEDEHLAGIQWTITPLNWCSSVTIRSGLNGHVTNDNVKRYKDLNRQHLAVESKGLVGEFGLYLEARTLQSDIKMTQAARTSAFLDGNPVAVDRKAIIEPDSVWHELTIDCARLKDLCVEKIVSIYSSRDRGISEPTIEAKSAIIRAARFDALVKGHARAWLSLWNRCDLKIKGSVHTQSILRLHIFHLLQTTSPNSIDVDAGIPARGWHGEAYRGHIFWDELFVMPFLNLRMPEISRELLMYRYRRLTQARRHASDLGYEGAMYPWQSGSNGREECPALHLNPNSNSWLPDLSAWQRHVGAAIAFNVWQYYQATHDFEFLSLYGAKMIFEISRFLASLTTYNSTKHRYEILHVVGPDEFHTGYPWRPGEGIDNNAYTNIMVSWTLSHALTLFDLLGEKRKQELVAELSITDEELHRWKDICSKLFVPFLSDGILAQFEGYDCLKEFDWKSYREKYPDLQRLDRILEAKGDSPDNYKITKQADVLMLFYLFSTEELSEIFERLGYTFDPSMIPANIKYYSDRVSHGSTLSRIVHSWVHARLDRPCAWHLFKEALHSDISDIQGGTTGEGIHLAAMAGTVDIMQRCFTGIEMRNEVLWFNPNLPDELPELEFRIRYGGHWLSVLVSHKRLKIEFEQSWMGPVKIGYGDQIIEMHQGDSHEFVFDQAAETFSAPQLPVEKSLH